MQLGNHAFETALLFRGEVFATTSIATKSGIRLSRSPFTKPVIMSWYWKEDSVKVMAQVRPLTISPPHDKFRMTIVLYSKESMQCARALHGELSDRKSAINSMLNPNTMSEDSCQLQEHEQSPAEMVFLTL